MKAHERFEYRGWDVEVQRKAFRRRLSIVLRPGKPIQIKAAALTSLKTIYEFMDSRKDWIDKNLRQFQDELKNLPSANLFENQSYPFLGRDLALKIVPTLLKKNFFAATDLYLLFHVPHGTLPAEAKNQLSQAHELLRDFYRREGGKVLRQRVAHWAEKTRLVPMQVKIREARTRWGACNPKKVISLNWRLAVYKPEIIDYVVVHELAHLKHMNHSKDFWKCVEDILPDSPELMKEIKTNHRLSDFLEAR